MLLAYVCLQPVDVEEAFCFALESKSPEEMLKFSSPLVRLFQDIRSWTTDVVSGRIICEYGPQLFIEISMDRITELNDFVKKTAYTHKTGLKAGIGMNICDAYCAMQTAQGDDPVMFTEEMPLQKDESQFSLDLPNFDLSEDKKQEAPNDSPPAPQDAPQEEAKPSTKEKVIQALMAIKQQAPAIAKLKEVSPEAYNSIKAIIEAMILMTKEK
jgi:hypothetical protein